MKFIISEKANEDIEKIWLYTYENWSLEQADRYYNLILDEIEFIVNAFRLPSKLSTGNYMIIIKSNSEIIGQEFITIN